MRWHDFDRALCEEIRKFQIPKFYVPIAAASDEEIGTVIADLDSAHRAAVDVIVTGFCETGNWRIRSHNERVLIWLRLNFAWQTLGFLALDMQDCRPQWMPFTVVARIHDDCDDASLWRWFLIDAWHRCGVAHIQNTFNCIYNLRLVPAPDVQK